MNLDGVSKHLLICNGKTCTKNGAEEVTETIREELKNLELQKEIHTTKTYATVNASMVRSLFYIHKESGIKK
ncbi:(2Fe-2S) ferredoxin domain-containing protein [Peribacillus frigoritolerans]|uniref:(2Fe-2S) ferredoxin domain-containing protein n=1 Tax=Peribacillus frigoritolerans TaxID=450367 RepID=UPI003ECFBDF8